MSITSQPVPLAWVFPVQGVLKGPCNLTLESGRVGCNSQRGLHAAMDFSRHQSEEQCSTQVQVSVFAVACPPFWLGRPAWSLAGATRRERTRRETLIGSEGEAIGWAFQGCRGIWSIPTYKQQETSVIMDVYGNQPNKRKVGAPGCHGNRAMSRQWIAHTTRQRWGGWDRVVAERFWLNFSLSSWQREWHGKQPHCRMRQV